MPTDTQVLQMTQEERQLVQQAKVVTSRTHKEKQNTILAYATKVMNVQEVRAVQKHLKLKHLDATHIVTVYHLPGEMPNLRDYDDNGEIGCRQRILQMIKAAATTNVAVFIVRYHSGKNLGLRRFEIFRELADDVLADLQDETNMEVSKLSQPSPRKMKGWQKRTRGGIQGIRGGVFFARGGLQSVRGNVHKVVDSDSEAEVVFKASRISNT